jgi:hypothetical protein
MVPIFLGWLGPQYLVILEEKENASFLDIPENMTGSKIPLIGLAKSNSQL